MVSSPSKQNYDLVELSFGEWLRRRRRSLDCTQAELAHRVGCAEGTIRKFEAEILRPSKQMAARLAEECGIAAVDLDNFIAFARGQRQSFGEAAAPDQSLERGGVAFGKEETDPSEGDSLLARTAVELYASSPLLGRAQEVAAICVRLQEPEVRLLTLLGPPGVGKTHLALQVAAEMTQRFALPAVVVALAAIQESPPVLNALARAVAMPDAPSRDLLTRVQKALQNQSLLLLLDNMEQIVEAGPLLVELMRAAPQIKLLVTSRVALRLSGEYLYTIDPLPLPDLANLPPLEHLQQIAAVALFVARAKAVRHDFTLTAANAAAVAAICVRLDGLPLAIELAAARVKLFPPTILLARLDRRLDVLTQGPRDRLPRQQTLAAAIAWSFNLLAPNQQRLFMRLGVFVGGCTLEAACAICKVEYETEAQLVEGLESLLDHSLIRRHEQAGELWLTMLETLREYALEQLARSGDEDEVRRRVLSYYRTLLEAGAKHVEGANQPDWLERFSADYENVQAALAWSLNSVRQQAGTIDDTNEEIREEGLRIAGASWWTWWVLGLGTEGRGWLRLALNQQGTQNFFRARALYAAGTLSFFGGDSAAADEQLRHALALYQELNDRAGEAHTLIVLAGLTAVLGDLMTGDAMLMQSIALFRALGGGERWGLGLALVNRRLLTIYRGEYEEARRESEEALALFRALGQPYGIALALNALADIARVEGDATAAVPLYREALGQIERSGVKSELPSIMHNLAYGLLTLGEKEQSQSLFRQAFLLQLRVESHGGIAESLTGLAGVAIQQGNAKGAAQLFGLVATYYGQASGPTWPPERFEYERYLAATRASLDAAAFAAAWCEGQELPLSSLLETFTH